MEFKKHIYHSKTKNVVKIYHSIEATTVLTTSNREIFCQEIAFPIVHFDYFLKWRIGPNK